MIIPHCKNFLSGYNGEDERTLMVPSNVPAMTTLFKESLAKPVTHRSLPFFVVKGRKRSTTSGGQGPMLKLLRFMPDCMFHMWISPVDEHPIPKLPHAVTQTA